MAIAHFTSGLYTDVVEAYAMPSVRVGDGLRCLIWYARLPRQLSPLCPPVSPTQRGCHVSVTEDSLQGPRGERLNLAERSCVETSKWSWEWRQRSSFRLRVPDAFVEMDFASVIYSCLIWVVLFLSADTKDPRQPFTKLKLLPRTGSLARAMHSRSVLTLVY